MVASWEGFIARDIVILCCRFKSVVHLREMVVVLMSELFVMRNGEIVDMWER